MPPRCYECPSTDVAIKLVDPCGHEHYLCARCWEGWQEFGERLHAMLDRAVAALATGGGAAGVAERLTVHGADVALYGACEACRVPRWTTLRVIGEFPGPAEMKRSLHCGCCSHPHNLPVGVHHLNREGGGHGSAMHDVPDGFRGEA